ncbi:MAG: ribosome silencing factor [Coriobacteriales bacterium]|jgi:ribosome-associated protein|nr:ribosome silencing factor [Coriobacteriales bacterium]
MSEADLEYSKRLALIAASAAFDKVGKDIIVQDVSKVMVITDYFVIATGANNRQVDAIADAIEEALREQADVKPIGREGREELTWVLLDYGDIVVHVFQPQIREFYRLETIWNDAKFLNLEEHGIKQDSLPEWIHV